MCKTCWQEDGAPQIDTPATRAAAEAIAALYEEHGAGGLLHLVTDDYNTGDSSVEYCGREIERSGTSTEKAALVALAAMTEAERLSAISLYWGDWGGSGSRQPAPSADAIFVVREFTATGMVVESPSDGND